ncbi:DegT/DnrJ/EryC1/StrS family aminotransferase [Candidatus Nitrosotenuis chungbukensis]|nr:DegT/DnrJ/EryC1/StrS family aminotransferase [Candidatus Nitrosotenuis chungbukensis]WKT58323.1 DegT/DnrJ/EryC1/StrS family aminotransferase [Candidatus Nitrosotenuis chungbukensis]
MRVERNGNISRDKLFSQLLQYGIKTTVHYKPLHEFTAFNKFKSSKDEMKNSKQLYEEIISLPFYPNMPKKQQDFVIDCIIKIMNS